MINWRFHEQRIARNEARAAAARNAQLLEQRRKEGEEHEAYLKALIRQMQHENELSKADHA